MTLLRSSSILLLSGFFMSGIALAQESKIKRSDLPPAVEKTVAEVSKDATVKGFNKEKENGKLIYEVEMIANGHTKDVQIDPTGVVTEIEEEVAFDALTPGVQSGLNTKADGAKILKVESLTKKGKIVAYEAQVEKAGKKSEIQVGPDGKPLNHEE